jgi:prepilin-type processing-associated H-X9-DG protein
MEQVSLYQLGSGGNGDQIQAANRTRIETPLAVWNCPSRRASIAYPMYPALCDWVYYPLPYTTKAAKLTVAARTDYAANGGQSFISFDLGPTSLDIGDSGTYPFPIAKYATGVTFVRSEITMADIRDGTSNTYMVGEKSISPDLYETGRSNGDDQSIYIADDKDTVRWASNGSPHQDQSGNDDVLGFGSAHANSCNMTFCDGSVRSISYTVSQEIHNCLCNRADGTAISDGDY